jgi:MYXO-CTERM domain-containing protein
MTPQVLVHTGTNPVTMTGQRQGAPHTWILNASQKGLNTQPGLLAGGSFSDPAGGLTVTVQSLDADKAVIQVEYAAGTTNGPACLDNTVLSGSGPAACNGAVVTTDAGPNPAGTGGTTGTPRDAGRDTGLAGAGGRPPEGGAGSGQGGSVVGTGGAIGEAGAAGTGNGTGGDTPGVGGGAGVSIVTTTGTAGTSPKETTTGPGLSQAPSDLAGGCACRVGAQAPATNDRGLGALAMLGIAGLFGSRRRSRQR